MKEILRLEHLNFSYEGAQSALKDLSVTLCEGERIAVLGNNGAGKSTFFLCCNGVLKPTDGSIFLHGQKLSKDLADMFKLRRSVGLVFQDPDAQLIAGTVEAEVSFGPMNLKLPVAEVGRRVNHAIAALNLELLRTRSPHTLSGGEKKRVTLADILAMQSELLLMDEPTSSLDLENSALLEQYLENLHASGMGLVIATHNVDFAWRWAHRILVFHNGELCADASPDEIFADETLLKKSGLAQPILYQVGKRLGLSVLPKTVDEII